MKSAVNLAYLPPINAGIVTSLFDLTILLFPNLKELLNLSILSLSSSLSLKLSI